MVLAAVWSKFIESHEYVKRLGDARTQDWPLVRSPLYPLAFLLFFYMPLVCHGPSLMAPFKPIQAKRILFAFNVFQIGYSTFMWTQFLYLSVSLGYSLTCEPVNHSTDWPHMQMAACIWHFYISKIIDLVDTLWFVLRKKERNISFLHIYHHSTQVFIWWIGVKFVPGGHTFFIGCINSMVHSLMYTYYLIASLGEPYKRYLWWKKYLTSIQMVQFVLVIAHSVGPLLTPGCTYSKALAVISTVYTVSVFGLFLNFYIVNYTKPASSTDDSKGQQAMKAMESSNAITFATPAEAAAFSELKKMSNGPGVLETMAKNNNGNRILANGSAGDDVRRRQSREDACR
jgi:elongation of very long chain fatty acids protein 4